jgi:hypothetical protein
MPWSAQRPTWQDAKPAVIAGAVERARALPSGNWFVLGASAEITGARPLGCVVAGQEVVAWRDAHGTLLAGPGRCPHLGAPLGDGRVDRGCLICRWHGLALDGTPFAGWRPYPAFDDGMLAWIRLDEAGGETPLPRPVLPERAPAGAIGTVTTLTGRCESEDVVANRLDPWHGAWFHPYSFADLRVINDPGDGENRFLVEVTFRVARRVGARALATFSCTGPRTVVMRIVAGEGEGSVVETHATPLGCGQDGHPRTAVIEATLAYSSRPGFVVARAGATAVRPLLRALARRLWRDDLAYAERRYALRAAG